MSSLKLKKSNSTPAEGKAEDVQKPLFSAINNICMAGNEANNLQELLELSLKNTLDLFQARRGSIFLLNRSGKELTLKIAQGMKTDEQKRMVKRLGEGIVGRVAELKKPLLVDDISQDSRFQAYKSRKSYTTPSFICAPLMIKDKLIGVINIADKESGKHFTRDELILLDFLSNQIALNYQRNRLNQIVKHMVKESESLKDQLGRSNQEATQLKNQVIIHERLATIGKLAGGIAHEFNNPLDGVMRYTNLSLEHVKDDEVVRGYLLEIRQGLKRMANIVKSLLDCARNAPATKESIDLNACVEQVLKDLQPGIFQKNIQVETEFDETIPEIVDFGVERVVNNIMKNAIEAMQDKGVLTIKTIDTGSSLVLEVSDNGVGIKQENLERIFDPFFTTKSMDKGCGLGLTIVSEIVKHYKGKIQIQSAPNKGTTFRVTLPLEKS